jgi:bifunctional non-homologous end joining protein LigD
VKLDGWRVQVRVEDGTAIIRTRKGLDYTSTFPEIAKAARGLDNCIIDGEICAVGKDGLTDFSALQAAMKSDQTDKLILFAFDLLWLGDQDLRAQPLVAINHQTVERLAAIACLSPRQFGRAFHGAMGETPANTIERLQVEAAKLASRAVSSRS